MNRMLKKLNSSSSVGKVRTIEKGKKALGFFDIETEGKEINIFHQLENYAKFGNGHRYTENILW